MPSCDYCGKECGNAGGKKNHENSCDQNPANQAAAQQAQAERARAAEPAEPVGGEQAQQDQQQNGYVSKQAQRQMQGAQDAQQQAQGPPQQQPQQGQQQGGGLALHDEEQGAIAQEGGRVGAELLANLGSDDPQTRAKAKSLASSALASGIQHLGEKAARKELEDHERAKRGAGQTADPVDDVIDCGNCGKPIDQIPDSERFRCPHCQVTLNNPLA